MFRTLALRTDGAARASDCGVSEDGTRASAERGHGPFATIGQRPVKAAMDGIGRSWRLPRWPTGNRAGGGNARRSRRISEAARGTSCAVAQSWLRSVFPSINNKSDSVRTRDLRVDAVRVTLRWGNIRGRCGFPLEWV